MLKNTYILLTLTLAFTIYSCSKKEAEFNNQEKKVSVLSNADYSISPKFEQMNLVGNESKKLRLNLDDFVKKGVLASSLLKESQYVVLESQKGTLIGDINDLFFDDNSWIIVDSRVSKNVFKFSLNGSFESKIGRHGQGPGEYLSPTNVSVTNESIFVHSEFQGRIFEYDKNGLFRRNYLVPLLFDDFHVMDNKFFFNTFNRLNGHIPAIANHMVVSASKELIIESSSFYYDPDLYLKIRSGYEKRLKRHNGNLYYIQPFTSELYKINSKDISATKLIDFDFGEKSIEKLELIKMLNRNPININRQLIDNGFAVIEDFLINDNHILVKVLYKQRVIQLIINSTSGELTGTIALIDDIDKLMSIQARFLIGNMLISFIEPERLIEAADKLKKENNGSYENLLKKIPSLETIKASDNYIIRIDEI